jgi:hypothetical protein
VVEGVAVQLLHSLGLAVCALKLKSAFAPPRIKDGVHFVRTSLRTDIPAPNNDTVYYRGQKTKRHTPRWSGSVIESFFVNFSNSRGSTYNAFDDKTNFFQTPGNNMTTDKIAHCETSLLYNHRLPRSGDYHAAKVQTWKQASLQLLRYTTTENMGTFYLPLWQWK